MESSCQTALSLIYMRRKWYFMSFLPTNTQK